MRNLLAIAIFPILGAITLLLKHNEVISDVTSSITLFALVVLATATGIALHVRKAPSSSAQ